jgi:hypothetical protein
MVAVVSALVLGEVDDADQGVAVVAIALGVVVMS